MRRLLVLIPFLTVTACGDDGGGDAPGTLSEIEAEIFAKSCAFAACHKGAGPAGGLNLEGATHAKLVGVTATGAAKPLIAPGDPEGSYLFEKLTVAIPSNGDQMPPGAPLASAKIELIRSWIAAGAADD